MAVAFELPLSVIVDLFKNRGEQVFSGRGLPSGTVTRLLDLTRSVTGPTASNATAIASVVTEIDSVVAETGIPKSSASSGSTACGE